MKYLLLAYGNQEKMDKLSKAELAALGERCMAWDGELKATGKLVASGSLGWGSKRLRLNSGKLGVTDGPYLDTKEVVGGFVIIEAASFEEAAKLAALHPAARTGEDLGWGIELRPFDRCEAIEQALAGTPRSKVSTYLNFPGHTEEAFSFYRKVFRTEYEGPIHRMSQIPPFPGAPKLSAKEQNLVMHVALPILGGHVLMGTDAVESMGHTVRTGSNVTINLEPATRVETERLFQELSEGGRVGMPLQDMFWGAYHGMVVDRFGVQWMFNCAEKKA